MNIVETSIDAIKPYSANPRIISETAVASVADSLTNFGWQQPIVVDKNNFFVVGHTRFLAAKKLGYKKVPVHTAKDLTEEKIKAYRLLDNKLGELSVWDDELLNSELDSLKDLETDLEDLLSIFEADDSNNNDISFLDDDVKNQFDVQEKQVINELGDYVTLSFVMTPDDRDLVMESLKSIQRQEDFSNITQSLVKIVKELK